MKKITSLTFLLLTAVLFTNAQNIPNPSFEDWQNYSLGERPISWNTSDSVIYANGFGHSAVREATDICNLTYSLKLISCGFGTLAAPGVATNGIIAGSLSSYTVSGGSPDTARSKFLNGCVKYTPTSTTDKAVISAFLFRWNAAAGQRDTVAYTVDSISEALTLTSFNYPFTYLDYQNQPDTILVLLQSSKAVFNASVGSSMIVDNLSLSGWVGINETNSPVKSVKIFPMPTNQESESNPDRARLTFSSLACSAPE